jgi:methyltransferase (TIGR00027 family)
MALVRSLLEAVIDRLWPCVRGGVVARTRLLDEAVALELSGVRQLLILGAGFDTRPYRLRAMSDLAVFEVDHPTTQAFKRRGLARIRGGAPKNVRFVPLIFGKDTPADALAAAGFVSGMRTLALWEGTTNYLDARAVEVTLRFLASVLAVGSPLFFTYVHKGMLDGSIEFDGAPTTLRAVRRTGEPFTFGFDPSELPAYLGAQGFDCEWDVSVAQGGARFFVNEHVRLPEYYRVVKARRR